MTHKKRTNTEAGTEHTEMFFALIQVAVGKRDRLPAAPTQGMWGALFEEARRQAMAGLLYGAVEKLPDDQRPPKMVLLEWYALTERIRSMNRKMNACAVETHRFFEEKGVPNTIMKGQAMARLYDQPLLRTPGDIDIWLSGKRMDILRLAASMGPVKGLTHHHVHFPLFADIDVEGHTRSSCFYDPIHNARFSRWARRMAPAQFAHEVELPEGAGRIAAPTADYDRVYILQHIYHHLFGEGIGMRQFADYYHVLRQGFTPEERDTTCKAFRDFGMMRFARATMWILGHVFGLEEQYFLVPPDEREGRFVLREVMMGGNFGKHDPRYDRSRHSELIPRVVTSLRRNLTFLSGYPREILWNPICRTIWYFETRLTRLRLKC